LKNIKTDSAFVQDKKKCANGLSARRADEQKLRIDLYLPTIANSARNCFGNRNASQDGLTTKTPDYCLVLHLRNDGKRRF
jgi:hypothetical protein